MAPPGAVLLAPSPAEGAKYDMMYYLKGAAAGGICCSITHGALTPVDGTSAVSWAVRLVGKLYKCIDTEANHSYSFNLSFSIAQW
jgi:hypothetical protein